MLALLTELPRIENPESTFALGQSFFMSCSLRPIPLPSCVQKGKIVLPEKSYDSKNVETAIGKVPHQLG